MRLYGHPHVVETDQGQNRSLHGPFTSAVFFAAVRLAGALLLVAAGALKLLEIAEVGYVVLPVWGAVAAPAATAVAVAELAAGLLLAHIGSRPVWLAFSFLYLAYAVLAGAMVAEGQESCGCFGTVEVPPALQVVVDVAIATGLFLAWRSSVWSERLWRAPLVVCVWGVAGALAIPVLTSSPGAWTNLRGDGQQVQIASLVQRPFPLALFASVRGQVERLGTGEWLVVIGTTQCSLCKRWLERLAKGEGSEPVAWCVVDGRAERVPAVKAAVIFRPRDQVVLVGRLPVVLRVRDGVVEAVAYELRDMVDHPGVQGDPGKQAEAGRGGRSFAR